MQIIKRFDKQANYIFYVTILIHLLVLCVEFGAWDMPLRGRLLQLAFGLGCIKILMTYYEKYEWILMIILGGIGALSYVFTKEKYVLYVVVLVFAAKSVDMKLLIKVIMFSTLLATLLISILSLMGVGGPASLTLEFRPGQIETRYCLGFSHPNNVHGTLWYIVSLAIILYKDRFDWRIYTALTVINVVLYIFTDSKAGLGVTQLMIIAGLAYKYANNYFFEKKWIYIIGALIFVTILTLTIISVNVCGWYGYGPVLSKIDSATAGRISIAYNNARMSWWKPWYGYHRKDIIVDNGFASLGNDLGYVIWIAYLLVQMWLMYICAKKKNGILFAIMVTCQMYTFMESSYMLNFVYLLSNLSYITAMQFIGKGTES